MVLCHQAPQRGGDEGERRGNGHDAGMPDGLEDNGFPVSTLFFRSGGGSPDTLHKVAHAHGPHGHPLGDEEDGGEHQALSTKDALRDGVAQESGVGADRAIHGMMCPQTPQSGCLERNCGFLGKLSQKMSLFFGRCAILTISINHL